MPLLSNMRQLEVAAKLQDALVRLRTPCKGPWTDPLAILVLLVPYMPLAHRGQQKNRSHRCAEAAQTSAV